MRHPDSTVAVALPGPMPFADLERFRTSPVLWLPAAAEIARFHSFPSADLRPFPNGSNLVCALGAEQVLKLYPPMLREQYVAETATLEALSGRLSVRIPEILGVGERDGWTYLIMSQMRGEGGDSVWPRLDEQNKERILRQIGALVAEVQAVPPGRLLELEPRWPAFLAEQRAACRARHERQGLPEKFLDGLDAYLEREDASIGADAPAVILTGEYIPENFLLERRDGRWNLSGLIDFGDVMTGARDYDLLGPSTFMGGGQPGRIRSLLSGFGYSPTEQGPALRRRLMTLYLLHRFSAPARQIWIDGWQERADSLDALAELIWPLGPGD